jgi:hypothetical protein
MINTKALVLQIAEKVREIATRQGNVPFDKGDLRKSHVVHLLSETSAEVGSNLPYARAVHDGRPALTIRPKNGKALKFTSGGKTIFAKAVHQKARKGRPWLAEAAQELGREGLGFLEGQITEELRYELWQAIRNGDWIQKG